MNIVKGLLNIFSFMLIQPKKKRKKKVKPQLKAAEITRRWGSAGGHTVFLRDIPPEKAAQEIQN